MALNPKQGRFVAEYLIDLNATQAAIRAGYSKKTAQEQGSRLLSNAIVAAELAKRAEKQQKRLEISADRVLQEIAKLAFFDPRKLFNDDGKVKEISELDDETAAAVAGLDVYEEYEGRGEGRTLAGYTKKFKLADKRGSLELLGKHLKLFTDRVEHTGNVSIIRTSVPRPAR